MEDRLYRINHAAHYRRMVGDSHEIVQDALSHFPGPMAVAVSGGKDSVAMAHIVAQYCRPLIIWNDSGLELPDSKGVVYALAEQLGLDVAVAEGNALESLVMTGADADRDNPDKLTNAAIIQPVKALLKAHGIALEFVGLRQEESRNRRMLLRRYGPIHDSKRWECGVAWPMSRWKAEDVLAYIDEHQLPLHPAYTRTDWQSRLSIRVSWAWDPTRDSQGDVAYLRRYYPSTFRAIRDTGAIDAL